jgi:hypothetical protein
MHMIDRVRSLHPSHWTIDYLSAGLARPESLPNQSTSDCEEEASMLAKTTTLTLRKVRLGVGVLGLAVLPLCISAAEPEPFTTSRLKQASTTIQAISQSDRHLVLLGDDGKRLLVEAGPGFKNFNDVKAGDHVVVSYYEGVVAEVKPKGEGVQGVQGATGKSTSPAGEMPAGAVGRAVATTVRVESVDPATHTITFKRPDGVERTMTVEHPDAQRFISQLKSGDEVQITYREATAVSIQPARG